MVDAVFQEEAISDDQFEAVCVDSNLDLAPHLIKQFGSTGAKALLALVVTANRAEAARRSGISRATLYRHLADPEFTTALAELRGQTARLALEELEAATLTAVRVLVEIMEDKDHDYETVARIRAAMFILKRLDLEPLRVLTHPAETIESKF